MHPSLEMNHFVRLAEPGISHVIFAFLCYSSSAECENNMGTLWPQTTKYVISCANFATCVTSGVHNAK